jgi:hypothetical protein
VDVTGIIRGLERMMMTADCMEDYETLEAAYRYIAGHTEEKHSRSIRLPCEIGSEFYSVIGEKIGAYRVSGFRIEKGSTYIETESSMLFNLQGFGKYYFWTRTEAEYEFRRMRQKKQGV